MPRRAAEIYRRGEYWLAWDSRRDGTLRSPYLTIFWHDRAAGRVRSASTRTSDTTQGMIALDRRYLSDQDAAPAYCHACGQPIARAADYLLTDAIADYRLEVGDTRSSADSIRARLKHVLDFIESGGRYGPDTSCDQAAQPDFADQLRIWSRGHPVQWRNKKGVVTVSRQRSPASTEEAIIQLAATLNHAVTRRRSETRPAFKSISRRGVSSSRRVRTGVPVLAEMLAYAAEPKRRRESLHAFLVASLCTIGRPDAIFDISVAPQRRQWWPGSTTLDLNPAGRVQTRKFRAVLPVLPVLHDWLVAAHAEYVALTEEQRIGRGWLVNYYGRPVSGVNTIWTSMLEDLALPRDREWMPYVLRHSVATLARSRGAVRWELEGFLGHRSPSTTETYAVGDDYPSVCAALASILSEIEQLRPGVLHRNPTGAGSTVVPIRRT